MPPLVNLADAVTRSAECGRVRWTASRTRVFTAEFFCTVIIAGGVFLSLVIKEVSWELEHEWRKIDMWWDEFIFIMLHIYTPALPLLFV